MDSFNAERDAIAVRPALSLNGAIDILTCLVVVLALDCIRGIMDDIGRVSALQLYTSA